jgi:hypothetical protein
MLSCYFEFLIPELSLNDEVVCSAMYHRFLICFETCDNSNKDVTSLDCMLLQFICNPKSHFRSCDIKLSGS